MMFGVFRRRSVSVFGTSVLLACLLPLVVGCGDGGSSDVSDDLPSGVLDDPIDTPAANDPLNGDQFGQPSDIPVPDVPDATGIVIAEPPIRPAVPSVSVGPIEPVPSDPAGSVAGQVNPIVPPTPAGTGPSDLIPPVEPVSPPTTAGNPADLIPGMPATEPPSTGGTATDLIPGGGSATDLIPGGGSATDLIPGGGSATDLIPGGGSATDLIPGGAPSDPGNGGSAISLIPDAGTDDTDGHGDDDRPAFDPIAENGPIFVGWPKPQVALAFSGVQHGYIEPCGCAGLDRMKGGMSRRHSMFRQFAEWGWPVVGLDLGGTAKGFGLQSELKFHTMVSGQLKMGYDAIALGLSDLQLPVGQLVSVTAPPSPFVSANVGLFGFDAELNPHTQFVERGGLKIAITSVLGDAYRAQLNNEDLKTMPVADALKKVLPGMLAKDPDLMVLLVHASMPETKKIIADFPQFDIVATSGGMPEPPALPQFLGKEGEKSMLVEVGEKGMNMVVVGVYNDPQQPFRYQRVPLDSRYKQSPDMIALMESYQDEVAKAGFAGLGIRPLANPLTESNGNYVGSKECQTCHEGSYDIWRKTGHAHALATLKNKEPPRHFDPECLACHVIGWDPGTFYPYKNGYMSEQTTPHLKDVGCESCHGPGELHVKEETAGKNQELMDKYRKAVRITLEESRKSFCITCHDGDNSPGFKFDEYWPKVDHNGADDE